MASVQTDLDQDSITDGIGQGFQIGEDNPLVIFYMKGCVVRRRKNECAERVFLTPYDPSE